jgi:hypothetical protein
LKAADEIAKKLNLSSTDYTKLSAEMVHFQQYFSYIVAVSFIGGGNQSIWRKNHRPVASH